MTDFGHFVCNQKQFIPFIFHSIEDIDKRDLLTGYSEIQVNTLTKNNTFFDRKIGLLHKDTYWDTLFAVRHISCLDRLSPVVFRESIKEEFINLYLKFMESDKSVGQKIYQTAFDYFKNLWQYDEYFSSTNINTIEKFLRTIEIQAIYIEENGMIVISFRPSWDEEHGLYINLNMNTLETFAND